MAYAWTTTAQQTLPSAATSVAVTPSGSAWVSGAWATLGTMGGSNGLLTGITIRTLDFTVGQYEIDIAVGAGPAVIATVKGMCYPVLGVGENGLYIPLPIPVSGMTAGAAIKARLRTQGTSVTVWHLAITYLTAPLVGSLTPTAQPLKVVPSAATMVTLTAGASAWVNSPWVQLIAATSTAIVVAGLGFAINGGHEYRCAVDVGIGGAGSETVITTLHARGRLFDAPWITMFPNPLNAIAAGVRVAMRWRTDGDFPYDGGTALVALHYHELPL